MKPGAKKLYHPLPGVKTLVDGRRRSVLVSVTPGAAGPEELRAFLYRLLNSYEKEFSIFITGVPFCFLPDASDHILPPVLAGKAARLKICSGCRLSGACPGLEERSFFRRRGTGLRPVLGAPAEIVFEVNRRCNLACAVCSSRRLAEELSLPAVKKQLRKAAALGIRNVRFTGGEPFLHPRILDMLAAARKAGFYVLVNTNATLLTPALVKKAAPLMDNVLVSMQGWDAASDAAATGVAGLFADKLRNLRLLRRHVEVLRLGTIISPALPASLDRHLRLARELRADVWELYRPMTGAGGSAPEVTPALLRRLAARLARMADKGPQVLFANPVPLCLFRQDQAPLFLGARFDDGHTRLVLDPRGFFKPSYYIQKDLGKDLVRAWNSPFLKSLGAGAWLDAGCRSCVFRLRCLGGSRFMAHSRRGDYLKKDPWLKGPARPFAPWTHKDRK